MMTRAQRRRLPKAQLFSLGWSWRYFYFAKFRGANFARAQFGWLILHWRMPYLEHVARQIHPHVFA